MENLIAKAGIEINASTSKVWQALVSPELIKLYLFGTNTITDWKVGSPIIFENEWDGTRYQDKGTILVNDKEKQLSYSYWSSMSSLPDIPEHYANVTFDLTSAGSMTSLAVTQDHCSSEDNRQHCQQNWNIVLASIKEIVEKL